MKLTKLKVTNFGQFTHHEQPLQPITKLNANQYGKTTLLSALQLLAIVFNSSSTTQKYELDKHRKIAKNGSPAEDVALEVEFTKNNSNFIYSIYVTFDDAKISEVTELITNKTTNTQLFMRKNNKILAAPPDLKKLGNLAGPNIISAIYIFGSYKSECDIIQSLKSYFNKSHIITPFNSEVTTHRLTKKTKHLSKETIQEIANHFAGVTGYELTISRYDKYVAIRDTTLSNENVTPRYNNIPKKVMSLANVIIDICTNKSDIILLDDAAMFGTNTYYKLLSVAASTGKQTIIAA